MYLKLAWRNIWRNKRRSLITIASIFFAVLLAINMRSMQLGTYDKMIENVVGLYSGYLQVHQKGYGDEQTLDNSMAYDSTLVEQIDQLEKVSAVVPRLESFALSSHGEKTKGAMVTGVAPQVENAIMQLSDRLVKGEMINRTDRSVLMSSGLADYFDIGISDTIVLLGQGYHGASAAGKYAIKGIVEFNSPELNNRMVLLPLKEAQWLYGTGNRVTSLAITIEETRDLSSVKRRVLELTSDEQEVKDWKEMMPEVVQGIQVDSAGGLIMLFVLYMVISFGMFGTVLMMTAERMYEFGVLVSVGMKRWKLIFVVLIETVSISLIGVFTGIIASAPIVFYFNRNPIQLAGGTAEAMRDYGMEAVIPFSTDQTIALTHGMIVLAVGVFTSIYPAVIIYKMKAVKAMRK